MRLLAKGLIGILLISLIQVPVQAETDGYVLYGIRTDGGYWLTPDANAPNEGGLWGSSIQGVVPSPYAPVAGDGREWILDMYDAEAPMLVLDAAGNIVVTFTIGGGTAEVGTFDAGWELRQDGDPVVSGPVKSVTYTQDTTSLLWEVPAGIDSLDLATLSLRIFTESSVGLGQRLSFTDQPTISLPAVGTGGTEGAVHVEDVGSSIAHAFTNPTSDTYHLNFTSDLANSTAEFSWEAVNGSVNASLLDADGAVLFEGVFEGNGTLSHEILGAAVGAWNLTLAYNDFNGKFSFDLAELAGEEPEAPQSPDPVDNSTTEDNATAPVNSADQESPGLALVAVIGAIAIALRRRF